MSKGEVLSTTFVHRSRARTGKQSPIASHGAGRPCTSEGRLRAACQSGTPRARHRNASFAVMKRSLELCPFRRTPLRDDRRACDEEALPPGALAVSTTPYVVPTDVMQVRRPPRTFCYVRRDYELLNDAGSALSEGV